MKLIRKMLMLVILVVAFQGQGAVAQELTLQQVIARCTEAAGGKAAIEAVQSVRIRLTIEEPTFKVEGDYRADRKLQMRIDIYSDQKRVYTEAYDGKNGWQMGDGPATDSKPEGSAALLHGIITPGKLFGLHEQEAIGNQLELVGREIVDKVNYYMLKLTLKDGFVLQYYVNPDTWLIERSRDVRALHPDLDSTLKPKETVYSDFRKVAGVVRSFKSSTVDLNTGAVLSTDSILEVETNPKLDDAQFQKP